MSAEKQSVEFVKYVLDQICEHKEAIEVSSREDELGILLTIKVSPEDMGRLIGKQGKTIAALRSLVRVIGARDEQRINLKVIE